MNSKLIELNQKLLKSVNEKGNNLIDEHFSEQKRLIELAVEEKLWNIEYGNKTEQSIICNEKNNLRESSESLMQQLNENKQKCFENRLKINKAFEKVEKLAQKADNFLMQKQSQSIEYEIQAKHLEKEIEKELVDLKSQIFSNKLLRFDKAEPPEDETSIGCLYFETVGLSSKTKLISGSGNGEIKVWDLQTYDCMSTFKPHKSYVTCIHMLSSNRIVTSSSDFSMKILNLTTGFCLKTFSSPVSDGFVRQIEAWNNELVTCSQSYIIKWNIEENKNEKIIREGSLCIKVIENNQLLSCDDRSIKVWDLVSGECLKLILVNHQIDCFQVLLDGTIVSPDRVISSGKTVKTLKRWHLASKDPLQTLPDTHGLGIHCMNALENNRMATGSFDKKIKIWDLNAEKCVLTLEGHSSFVNSLVMISNEIIASCSSDKTIRLWNIIDGTCIKTIEGHTESIGCIQAI